MAKIAPNWYPIIFMCPVRSDSFSYISYIDISVHLSVSEIATFLSMSLNFIIAWDNEKWYNKQFWSGVSLEFLWNPIPETDKSIVIAEIDEIKWQQYRTIGPEIQGFLLDRQSFYRTCPSVRWYFAFTVDLLVDY